MNLYRPLSPHLLIYKPQLNALGSILHRFTGAYISLGLILFIFALKFVAQNVHIHFIYLLCRWAEGPMA
jgi:succinate dehydrogenase cytochrome b556 subunit